MAYSNSDEVIPLVGKIVTTYHPENVAKKDDTYRQQIEQVTDK